MEANEKQENKMRVNIKQTSKGEPYWDVTAKGDTQEEVRTNLENAIQLAQDKCDDIKEMNDVRRKLTDKKGVTS